MSTKADIPDSNDVTFGGTIITEPTWFQLSVNKRALIFTIRSEEVFQKFDGSLSSHPNEMDVEVLGRSAEQYYNDLSTGMYCSIKGYIRTDIMNGTKKARIRTFKISYKGCP